jgi:hypothetical protein
MMGIVSRIYEMQKMTIQPISISMTGFDLHSIFYI